jgi:Zn finger protein HypA/HybF involved in hydrogenase expression
MQDKPIRRSKIYAVSDDEFKHIVASSESASAILRKLGLSTNGGSSTKILKERILELVISVEHFKAATSNLKNSPVYSLEDICVVNSSYQNRTSLKNRLVSEGWLDYKCTKCGISKWNDSYISLHLDHINGINNDHSISNLRLLCPNCHSQTDTYAGKNKIRR